MPFESVYVEGAPVQAYLRPDSILSNSNITEYYKFQCNDTLRTRLESAHLRAVKLGRDSETTGPLLTDSNDALSAAARNLSASTLTLLRLVRRMKGNLSKTNLQGVVIANGSLDDLDLSGADLRSALLAGNAKDFTCEGCDLRYADFRDLNLFSGGSLEGSNTTGLQLPEK